MIKVNEKNMKGMIICPSDWTEMELLVYIQFKKYIQEEQTLISVNKNKDWVLLPLKWQKQIRNTKSNFTLTLQMKCPNKG